MPNYSNRDIQYKGNVYNSVSSYNRYAIESSRRKQISSDMIYDYDNIVDKAREFLQRYIQRGRELLKDGQNIYYRNIDKELNRSFDNLTIMPLKNKTEKNR